MVSTKGKMVVDKYCVALLIISDSLFIFTCVAEGKSRSRSAVTPSVRPSVPKSCHRNSFETTDPIAYWLEILIPSFLWELCPLELREYS